MVRHGYQLHWSGSGRTRQIGGLVKGAIGLFIFVIAALHCRDVQAFPDGAPWGAANPSAEQHCASCHFGDEPVSDSAALVMQGLPNEANAGETYDLEVTFTHADIVIAGFQLIAMSAGDNAGTFSASADDLEYIGASIRSVAPNDVAGHAVWHIQWRAPDNTASQIEFYLAASAANDDGSPFGDTIHFKSYLLPGRHK